LPNTWRMSLAFIKFDGFTSITWEFLQLICDTFENCDSESSSFLIFSTGLFILLLRLVLDRFK
jgi:hypothetical protein